eukprot:COSAG02_NODE_399_length_23112_cov_1107.712349_23_plen_95_part_00
MSGTEEVDEEHLELVEMRLDIDVEALRSYLVANSDFPDGPVQIKQFNKGQSNPTVRVELIGRSLSILWTASHLVGPRYSHALLRLRTGIDDSTC